MHKGVPTSASALFFFHKLTEYFEVFALRRCQLSLATLRASKHFLSGVCILERSTCPERSNNLLPSTCAKLAWSLNSSVSVYLYVYMCCLFFQSCTHPNIETCSLREHYPKRKVFRVKEFQLISLSRLRSWFLVNTSGCLRNTGNPFFIQICLPGAVGDRPWLTSRFPHFPSLRHGNGV